MHPWQYFSYGSACAAVLLMLVLALTSIASPSNNNLPSGSGETSQQTFTQDDYQNAIEQVVTIIEPTRVPQEVTILKR